MVVRALASAWATQTDVPPPPTDSGAEGWLSRLADASPEQVNETVVQDAKKRVVAGVTLLLGRAHHAATAGEEQPDDPELLQLIVSRGHGTDFPGGTLAESHAQFLIGVKFHATSPTRAHRAYELARLGYVNEQADPLARLAAVASATVKRALLAGGDATEVHEQLGRLREARPDVADALAEALRSYEELVIWLARGSVDDAPGPDGLDRDGIQLVRTGALDAVDDLPRAVRLARLADAAGGDASTRKALARYLGRQRRWADAVEVLTELHTGYPQDREVAADLARAYAELDRWPEGKAVLVGMLGDPPGTDDVLVLDRLAVLGFVSRDPDAEHWREVLVAIDPDADPVAGMPKAPGATEPRPLHAVFRDGQLTVAQGFFELPEEEQPVHLTAAMIAGSPEGRDLLHGLIEDDSPLAERVLALLGLRILTPEQSQAEEHFQAAEAHFQAMRFEDARREYQAALELNAEHATAAMYLGDTWYRRGAYHLAQAYFEESLAIEPSPMAYRFLGDALYNGSHGARRAKECYEKALALDPEYRGARDALATLSRKEAAGAPPEPAPAPEPDPLPQEVTDAIARIEAPPTERVRALEASGGSGDRVLAAALRQQGEDGFLGAADDDERFTAWLAAADPAQLVRAAALATAISFQYHVKDRDVARWRHWVLREVAMAEALPEDFGPSDSPFEHGRHRVLADALAALAELRVTERRLPEARLLYERSLELLTADDQVRAAAGLVGQSKYDQLFLPTGARAGVLSDLADICYRLGDPEAADDYSRQAGRLYDAQPTTESAVDSFIDGGDAALHGGRIDDALGAYQHAVYLTEDESPNPMVPRTITKALNGLGRGYHQVGALRAALVHFDRARRLNESTGNSDRLAYDHRAIAAVLRDRPGLQDPAGIGDAVDHLERSLVYASLPEAGGDEFGWTARDGTSYRISAPDRAWPTLLALGGVWRERSDYAAAARFLTVATRLADLLRAGLVDERQRIAVQNQQIDAFAQLTSVSLRLAAGETGAAADRYAAEAWLANESMRARTFLDALGDADLMLPPGVPVAIAERERELLERRRQLRGSGRQDEEFWTEYREVADELDALWQHMRAAQPAAEGYVEVRQARPAEPDDLAAMLQADDRPVVIASLVRVDDGTLAVLALRGDLRVPLIEVAEVDGARLDRFVRQNFGSAGRVRELAVDMEDLFQHELGPIGDLLTAVSDPGDLLVVCPVGVLHHVPLGALRPAGGLLLERNPIALLPTASLLRALRSAAHHTPATPAAVFGDPTGDLPGARSEAEAIAGRFGTAAKLGAYASRSAVRSALSAAGVVHVACHAHFDLADALASGLVLADGLLAAREILTLQAPALSLVALSACETGISASDAAEELVGLTRALLFAGADAIVVSLWKVPDMQTLDVMDGFYDGLLAGRAKVEALREAVLATRDRHGPDRMDRWAGFQLVGDWR